MKIFTSYDRFISKTRWPCKLQFNIERNNGVVTTSRDLLKMFEFELNLGSTQPCNFFVNLTHICKRQYGSICALVLPTLHWRWSIASPCGCKKSKLDDNGLFIIHLWEVEQQEHVGGEDIDIQPLQKGQPSMAAVCWVDNAGYPRTSIHMHMCNKSWW